MTDYATRLVNDVDTAQRLRLADGLLKRASGDLSSTGGVRLGSGGVVSLVAGSMRYKATAFVADVPGATAGQGSYPFVHDDPTTEYTLEDGDPLGARIDLVCARVRDDVFDGSGFTDAGIFAVKGDPTTGSVPAVPAGSIPLRELGVSADASAATGGVTLGLDRRVSVIAAGGIMPDGLGGGTFFNGTTWVPVDGGDTGWLPIPLTAPWSGATAKYRVKGGECFLQGSAVRGSGTSTAVGTMPAGARPSITQSVMTRTANTSITFGYNAAGALIVGSAYANGDPLYFDNISFLVD